jgi:penicillin-binding protein 2
MTPTQRPRFLPVIFALLLLSAFGIDAHAASRGKRAAQAKPAKSAKSARAERGSRAAKGRERVARAAKSSARETRAERRARLRDERVSAREVTRGARGRRLSRRERLEMARREAEARRRAELARLAAIARQRAQDQALREEVQANIAKDDPTGEDPEVRRVALAALGNHAASVVVMNPKTGRVYSIVNQQWGVRTGFKPCSTIKLVSGLAGVAEGVIDPAAENAAYNSRMNLTDALAYSINGYFQQVGQKVGFERMSSYARQLGLGERTGINHTGEYPGRLPLFKSDVGMLRMSSHGDDIEVTPVQLASLASVFANGGTLLVPHLPRTPEEDLQFKPEVRRQLNIPQESLRRMLPGMIGSINYGSGRKAYDPSETIAGKTGTCIGASGVWVGLFTSYAPVEDPQLAIAVVGRGTDAHSHVPAAIAGQIYRTLNYRFGKHGNRSPFMLTPDILAPKPKIDPSKIADTDDDEEAAGDASNAPVNDATKTDASAATSSMSVNSGTNVKPMLMPVPVASQTRIPASSNPAAPKSAAPPATKTTTPTSEQVSPDGRPRRVNTKNP